MPFVTRINFANNRQHVLPEREQHVLTGRSEFGLSFSALTSGPDATNSGATSGLTVVYHTFSSNTVDMNITFGDPRMNIAEDIVTPFTPSNSGFSQDIPIQWEGVNATVIDGNTVYLSYTGVNFDIEVVTMTEISLGVYTGTAVSNDVAFFSADSLDYTDRLIWVDVNGITRTQDLIISNGAQAGYVWTAINSDGDGQWAPSSGGTSGGTDIYTTGATLIGSIVHYDRNDVLSAYTVDLSSLTATTFWESSDAGTDSFKSKIGSGLYLDGNYSVISGGQNNTMSGDSVQHSAILGGLGNLIDGGVGNYQHRNAVVGGYNNLMSGATNDSFIGGGNTNVIGSKYSFIGGGLQNKIYVTCEYGSMLGGRNNTMITSIEGSILGGRNNELSSSTRSTIVHGYSNYIKVSTNSIIGNGSFNGIIKENIGDSNLYNFIGNGFQNRIYDDSKYSSIVNGFQNVISGQSHCTIVGGRLNTINTNASYSVISGGQDNKISGDSVNSSIIGGRNNVVFSAIYSMMGGRNNYIAATNTSSIVGGMSNSIYGGKQNVIGGGSSNETYNANRSGILTGRGNFIGNNYGFNKYNNYSGILAGRGNTMTGNTYASAIVGGKFNRVDNTTSYTSTGARFALVGGGYNNIISGDTNYSVIAGGYNNKIYSPKSFIAGGEGNTINSGLTHTFVLGSNITASASSMTYVNDLTIVGLTSTDPIATDSTGKIVAGTSDRRLKQNIQPLKNSIDKIKGLRGVSFEYTPESKMGGGLRYGFIAQEVENVIPEMVRPRAKGDGMLTLNYNEVIPWLVEAFKELVSGEESIINKIFKTQTIVAEDNLIELNYNGTKETAVGGGIVVKNAIGDVNSSFTVDEFGRWIAYPSIASQKFVLPKFTPKNSQDGTGDVGNFTWDENYLYIKTEDGWKRTSLESF